MSTQAEQIEEAVKESFDIAIKAAREALVKVRDGEMTVDAAIAALDEYKHTANKET